MIFVMVAVIDGMYALHLQMLNLMKVSENAQQYICLFRRQFLIYLLSIKIHVQNAIYAQNTALKALLISPKRKR